jgi:hypothetical protein
VLAEETGRLAVDLTEARPARALALVDDRRRARNDRQNQSYEKP